MRRATQGRIYHVKNKSISIHALREEGDVVVAVVENVEKLFLSTPSVRRATLHTLQRIYMFPISIHALREEGDFT